MSVNKEDQLSLKRSGLLGTAEQITAVNEIISKVRTEGDQALFELTQTYDGVRLNQLLVSKEERLKAYDLIEPSVIDAIKQAIDHIRRYHEAQKSPSWFQTETNGTILGQHVTALDSVGIYVPGGKAAYPSSVLMNVIPAQVAGVEQIAITTPPNKEGLIPAGVLVAANELGIERIYKVGGAQAIASLAYGTESIERVDKITGPGNQFVALAKRAVFGDVAIDMIAGPSEICILADEEANPAYIAADLLSQAEHDEQASAIMVTDSEMLAKAVKREVARQLRDLPKKVIAQQAIDSFGVIYITQSMDEAANIVNQLAPEHLEIMTHQPMALLGKIKHAGAIFIGPHSTEPVGDYFAGPSHVLPTNGTARFSSPLSVDDFIKKSSIIAYSKDALKENGKAITTLARLEGLEAHARAIDIRLEDFK